MRSTPGAMPAWGGARPRAANCQGCNPRELTAEALGRELPGVQPPRIDSGGTGPRTCVSGSMSTSEASCHGRELTAEALRRELPGVQPP